MNFVALAVCVLLNPLFQIVFVPPLDESDACISPADEAGDLGPTLLAVVSTLSWKTAGAGCPPTQADGKHGFHSDASGCTTPTLASGNGVYCSLPVAPDAELRCMWLALQTTIETKLFGGWDANLDGNIGGSEVVMGPMEPVEPGMALPQYVFENPTGLEARMLLFPTNIETQMARSGDHSLVGCLPVI